MDQFFKTFKTVFSQMFDDKKQLAFLILTVLCKGDAKCLYQKLIAISVLSNAQMQHLPVKHGANRRVNARNITFPSCYGVNQPFNKT